MPRTVLSEDAEAEERQARDRLRELDAKFRQLRDQRQGLLDRVHRLSDEQKELSDGRGPKQAALDDLHAEYRELGRTLSQLRHARDALRPRLNELLEGIRRARRPATGRAERPRVDYLKREMAQLELRQQTNALPIAEENALIGRLRQLRQQIESAEKEGSAWKAEEDRRAGLERELKAARAEFDRLAAEMQATKARRDGLMDRMRAELLEVGQMVAGIREKARERGEVLARVDELGRQLFAVDREANGLLAASHARRREARATLQRYAHAPRSPASAESAVARHAEENLEELLKRGRITLGG